jgi:hypothetical protein
VRTGKTTEGKSQLLLDRLSGLVQQHALVTGVIAGCWRLFVPAISPTRRKQRFRLHEWVG